MRLAERRPHSTHGALKKKAEKDTLLTRCINAECASLFDYRQGRLVRFPSSLAKDGTASRTHSVRHFWLCAKCAAIYTLEYVRRVVVLRLKISAREPEPPHDEAQDADITCVKQ
jgi:hypothetical protein